LPRSTAAKDFPGMTFLEVNVLPSGSLASPSQCFFFSVAAASVAWQMRLLSFPQAAVAAVRDWGLLTDSGHSWCRWPPPHHMHQGDCLQFTQIWPNFWQLKHWVKAFWVL
jgi:hypothetical protein